VIFVNKPIFELFVCLVMGAFTLMNYEKWIMCENMFKIKFHLLKKNQGLSLEKYKLLRNG
jgi:hypothetical protein